MKIEHLEQDNVYHIYNRGNNSQVIFENEDNFRYFIKLTHKHLDSYAMIYGYCLLSNHYHLIIKIEQEGSLVTQKLSNLFNAYTKAFNKSHQRTGSLFENRFKRKRVKDEDQLKSLILYVHTNAEHHGVVQDFRKYPFSSYDGYFNNKNSCSQYILGLFGGIENFKYSHN